MNNKFLFDFGNPNLILQRQTAQGIRRPSGTVSESVKHGVIHTPSPDTTIHHTIIGASPHPVPRSADRGEFYMIAYVSIPIEWIDRLSPAVASTWDVTFIGPAGTNQKLPPVLRDMEELLGNRVYVGFDWYWLKDSPKDQPNADTIKTKLTEFVNVIRDSARYSR